MVLSLNRTDVSQAGTADAAAVRLTSQTSRSKDHTSGLVPLRTLLTDHYDWTMVAIMDFTGLGCNPFASLGASATSSGSFDGAHVKTEAETKDYTVPSLAAAKHASIGGSFASLNNRLLPSTGKISKMALN